MSVWSQDHAPHIRDLLWGWERSLCCLRPLTTHGPLAMVFLLPSYHRASHLEGWHAGIHSSSLENSILWVGAGPTPFPLLTRRIFMPIGCYTDPFPTPPETIIYIFSRCIFIGMCSYNVCITVLLSWGCFLVRQDSHGKLTILKLNNLVALSTFAISALCNY